MDAGLTLGNAMFRDLRGTEYRRLADMLIYSSVDRFIYSFIHSLYKHLSGTVLDAE